jgi:spoIIIJ-associated protein
VDVALDEQAQVAQQFLEGLITEFGVDGRVRVERPDEDTVDLHVDGTNLGLLIGPKGATLLAIQDLTRTVVQRQTGATNGRIHVDIAAYRQKRAEALARFARQIAEEVRVSGTRKALEPMSAADRKVVHDTVGEIDGVASSSEGEDAARRVVISPASS